MIVHPRLLGLLEAGRDARVSGDLSSLSVPLSDARAFVLEQQGIFEALALAIPLRGQAADRVRDVRSLFAQALEALRGIEDASAANNMPRLQHELDRVESTMAELLPALGALDEVERQLPRHSPMPMINRVIRIASNVREGHLKPAVLRQHFGSVLHSVNNLVQNHKRFVALHEGPPDLLEAWDREFTRLEAGCGAMAMWFESRSDEVLLDALKLLKFSSIRLTEQLARMDEISRAEAKYSKLLALDELLRAAEGLREGRVDAGIVVLAAGTLQSLGGYYASALDTVPAFPLAFMLRAEWDALRVEMEALQAIVFPWMARLRADARAAAGEAETLQGLAVRFESASAAHQRLQDGLAAHVEALKGASNVQEVVDALGRLATRSVSVPYAVDRVEHFVALHRDLLAEIDATPNAELGEMRALLTEQAAAVEEMARYLEDTDEAHLRGGFMRLCAIHPRMMELKAELRSEAEEQKRARERTVACFRCGAANAATSRFCGACNSVLPLAAADEIVYTEISGGAEAAGTPENLRKLQSLYERAERGEALETVARELKVLHDQLSAVARDFDAGLGARAHRGDVAMLSEYADAFRGRLDGLLDGIRTMLDGARDGELATMQRGLDAAMAAGREMQSAQQELQAGMGLHTAAP